MSDIVKKDTMYAHLKASRHLGFKKYFGVVGKYLMEILDEEPIAKKISERCAYHYRISQESRMTGFSRRMTLKTFTDDCLIIFRSSNTADGESYNLEAFFNLSDIPDTELLKEASILAHHRWLNKRVFVISKSREQTEKLLEDGYLPLSSLHNLEILEKNTIKPN